MMPLISTKTNISRTWKANFYVALVVSVTINAVFVVPCFPLILTTPLLSILILSEPLPIEKIILFPVLALMPKFPVFCYFVFPVSLTFTLKPPKNELKFPVVIAPVQEILPLLSIVKISACA
jgi:hypothetical protein